MAGAAAGGRPCECRLVDDAIYALSRSGPTLGRPLVDTISHSKINNLEDQQPQGVPTWFSWQKRDPHPVRVRPVAVGDSAGRR